MATKKSDVSGGAPWGDRFRTIWPAHLWLISEWKYKNTYNINIWYKNRVEKFYAYFFHFRSRKDKRPSKRYCFDISMIEYTFIDVHILKFCFPKSAFYLYQYMRSSISYLLWFKCTSIVWSLCEHFNGTIWKIIELSSSWKKKWMTGFRIKLRKQIISKGIYF